MWTLRFDGVLGFGMFIFGSLAKLEMATHARDWARTEDGETREDRVDWLTESAAAVLLESVGGFILLARRVARPESA